MRTSHVLAFLLFLVAAVCAACKRTDWAIALVAAGLCVELVPAVFQIS